MGSRIGPAASSLSSSELQALLPWSLITEDGFDKGISQSPGNTGRNLPFLWLAHLSFPSAFAVAETRVRRSSCWLGSSVLGGGRCCVNG